MKTKGIAIFVYGIFIENKEHAKTLNSFFGGFAPEIAKLLHELEISEISNKKTNDEKVVQEMIDLLRFYEIHFYVISSVVDGDRIAFISHNEEKDNTECILVRKLVQKLIRHNLKEFGLPSEQKVYFFTGANSPFIGRDALVALNEFFKEPSKEEHVVEKIPLIMEADPNNHTNEN